MIWVTVAELEVARSASELRQWVEWKIERIAKQEGGTSALRLLKGKCKELVEEVFPLGVWGSLAFGSELVVIQPKIGSQSYDAIVTDSRSGQPNQFYVEVTQAHLGESEHLRRLHLERFKWAPGPLQPMSKTGTKATGLLVRPARVLGTLHGHVNGTERLIEAAINRKVRKVYPDSTRLVIGYEDFVVARADGIQQRLLRTVERAVGNRPCPFSHIYLVGLAKGSFVEWRRDEAAG